MPAKTLTCLQADLANANTTAAKLEAYHRLVDFLIPKNPKLAEQYMEEGLELATSANLLIHIVFFMYYQISFYVIFNNHKKAFEKILIVSPLLKKLKEKAIHYMVLADILYILYRNRAKSDLTSHVLSIRLKSLEIIDADSILFFKNTLEKNLKVAFLRQIAFTFLQIEQYSTAKKYLELATCLVGLANSKKEYYYLYCYWAEYYFRTKEAGLCCEFAHKALAVAHEMDGDAAEADITNMQLHIILGLVSMEYLQQYAEAAKYFEKAIQICIIFDLPLSLASLYSFVARLYKYLEDWKLAYEYAEKSNQAFLKDIKNQANQNTIIAQKILEGYLQEGVLEDFFKQKMHKSPQLATENEHLQYAQYIQTHCVNPQLTVQEIAQYFNMSAKSLNRQIQKFFGLSVQKFIIFLRLQKAHQLLTETNKSVTEIAEMVGFEHIPYFGICFKKQYGILPSKLKKSKK